MLLIYVRCRHVCWWKWQCLWQSAMPLLLALHGMQNLAEDWNLGSKGCYDAVSLTRLQMQLRYDFRSVAEVCRFACHLLGDPGVAARPSCDVSGCS